VRMRGDVITRLMGEHVRDQNAQCAPRWVEHFGKYAVLTRPMTRWGVRRARRLFARDADALRDAASTTAQWGRPEMRAHDAGGGTDVGRKPDRRASQSRYRYKAAGIRDLTTSSLIAC
jgi:hypothetical protein